VNYGARYRKRLPISSSIAESAVNQVVSHRMAKKQQMRWTDEGAHCLAQVRVADLNGELSVQRLAALAKMPCANSARARQGCMIRPPTVWFTLRRARLKSTTFECAC